MHAGAGALTVMPAVQRSSENAAQVLVITCHHVDVMIDMLTHKVLGFTCQP